MAHEAEEYPAMSESTTDIRIVPLPQGQDVLTEILRSGARRLLAEAVEAEVAAWIDNHAHLKDQAGRQQVVRNGHLPERTIQTGIGPVEVQQPRVRDRRPADERESFTSAILPPYLRKTRSLEGLIPWLYLKGVSTGGFSEALQAILGPEAPGLSAATVTRLKAVWESEHEAWGKRSLKGKHYVYVWADGVHFNIRLEGGRQCILVLMGATAEGKKELIAITDGYRESEQSWKELLLDCKARGLEVEPSLAIGDGALGFWKAMRQVWDTTKEQRCWVHTIKAQSHFGRPKSCSPRRHAEERDHVTDKSCKSACFSSKLASSRRLRIRSQNDVRSVSTSRACVDAWPSFVCCSRCSESTRRRSPIRRRRSSSSSRLMTSAWYASINRPSSRSSRLSCASSFSASP
jgi:hypothetical protein